MNITSSLPTINSAIQEPLKEVAKESDTFSQLIEENTLIQEPPKKSILDWYKKDISLEEYLAIMEKPNSDKTGDDVMDITKFRESEEFDIYTRQEMLKNGEKKETQAIFTIGEERIIYKDSSISSTDGVTRYLVSGDKEQTLENLYEAFGKEIVEVEFFEKGESPTNAELFERIRGENFYHYVMSGPLFG